MGLESLYVPKLVRKYSKYNVDVKRSDIINDVRKCGILIKGEEGLFPVICIKELDQYVYYAVKGFNYSKKLKLPLIDAMHYFSHIKVITKESGIENIRFIKIGELEEKLKKAEEYN